ncbi:hypothetical protein MRX96_015144 [Rhipicephalus microplus]
MTGIFVVEKAPPNNRRSAATTFVFLCWRPPPRRARSLRTRTFAALPGRDKVPALNCATISGSARQIQMTSKWRGRVRTKRDRHDEPRLLKGEKRKLVASPGKRSCPPRGGKAAPLPGR